MQCLREFCHLFGVTTFTAFKKLWLFARACVAHEAGAVLCIADPFLAWCSAGAARWMVACGAESLHDRVLLDLILFRPLEAVEGCVFLASTAREAFPDEVREGVTVAFLTCKLGNCTVEEACEELLGVKAVSMETLAASAHALESVGGIFATVRAQNTDVI